MKDKETLNLNSLEILKLFNNGVAKAIEEHNKLNIPSVFGMGKKIIYEMPNGDILTEYDYYKDMKK